MNFNRHPDLSGRHAFLSASKSSWVNYDEDKLASTYRTAMAAHRGTRMHDLAAEHIRLGIKMPRSKKTIDTYVNDAIGYRMSPEQILYYSENCFGTADAISFRNNLLRIHDLKTGITPTSMRQLVVYAAMFCLEYGILPGEITIELRIYQNDEVKIYIPELDEVVHIMGRIRTFDKMIKTMKEEDLA